METKSAEKKANGKTTHKKTSKKNSSRITKISDESLEQIIINSNKASPKNMMEQTVQYEKRIYDLEQLLDIAK